MTPYGQSSSKEPLTLLSFGVRQPVAANLLMAGIVLAGVLFGLTLRREMFPEIKPHSAVISLIYPGASPDEVEDGMALKVEDKIAALKDVDELTTSIVEGGGTVVVEFFRGTDDIDEAVNDVKAALDTIDDLPVEAEELRTVKFDLVLPVITISVIGDVPERELKRSIREIRDDLESLSEIGEIQIYGVRNDEIRVEVNPDVLTQYGMSLPDLSEKVRQFMQEIPGGTVRSAVESVRVRTMGTEERAESIRQIVVKADTNGGVVRLGQIATVTEGFADQDLRSRVNGLPAASATVVNTNDGDTIEMAELVRAYAAGVWGDSYEPDLRDRWSAFLRGMASEKADADADDEVEGVESADAGFLNQGDDLEAEFVSPTQLTPRERAYRLGQQRAGRITGKLVLSDDLARFIEGRLDLLSRNAFYGAILVFLVLLLALNIRVALWVMAGLVISLLGTLALMAAMGITLNLLTMFGLIVVLGLLVDDAIVVAENIVARYENGEPALEAAVSGTRQIAWPVVATVATTVAAFLPLRLIEGQMGDFLGALPIVVACALTVSILEALVILPSHMAHTLIRAERAKPGRIGRFFRQLEEARNNFLQGRVIPAFAAFVDWIIHYRYVTTAVALTLFVVSLGMLVGGRVEFTFFPASDSEILVINLKMPVGTSIESTNRVVQQIEAACQRQDEVKKIGALVGTQLDTNDWNTAGTQTHVAQIMLELKAVELRDVASGEVIANIRRDLGELSGISSLRFEELQGGPGGEAIRFVVTGVALDRMKVVVGRLKEKLREFEGVFDITDDLDQGQRELQITMRDGAAGLGLTPADIATQIRGALYGLEPHTFSANREDVKVRVMFAEGARQSLAKLDQLFIFTPTGDRVPLVEVASISETTGYASIKRLNRKRAIAVLADVDQAVTNPEAIVASMQSTFAALEQEFPGIGVEARGRQIENQKSMDGIRIGILLAGVLIYVILAWLFQSYFQPLAVMLAIPFSLIGVIWGHYLIGLDLTILSLIGFVALTGIIVNDSLIYMEFYNHRCQEGSDVYEALVETSRRRLRPIILTTLTTVLGLLPLMLENSFQAKFLVPMAVSIAFGLMSATVLILVVLPCLIVIGHDLRVAGSYLWNGRALDPDQAGGETTDSISV